MKYLALLPLFFLAACASHPRKIVTSPAPVGTPTGSDGLRTNEQLKEYRLGRYVDARDPFAMHEGHPLYRIETSARWDLRPNNGATLPRRNTVQPVSVSANDAVLAEVNKQRAATRAFTEQTAALNQRLTELGHAVEQTREVARQNLELKRDVATLREQLDSLDTKLRERKPPTASPSPSPEDKW
ncbi:MAG TPA: hypothetical protein VJU77_01025 [Chthoniobacterales bacterium]|nr:hypothetical protein [Chthoniobacterales bacterium]